MSKAILRLPDPTGRPARRERLTLVGEIEVEVRPYTALIVNTARARAGRRLREELGRQKKIVEHAGDGPVDFGEVGDLRDEDRLAAFYGGLIHQELAVEAIVDWWGVYPRSGDEPLEPSPANLRHAMTLLPNVARDFDDKYSAAQVEILEEGEGSGTSANTTSRPVEVPTTAKGAGTSTGAPAKTAPTRKAGRKAASD